MIKNDWIQIYFVLHVSLVEISLVVQEKKKKVEFQQFEIVIIKSGSVIESWMHCAKFGRKCTSIV